MLEFQNKNEEPGIKELYLFVLKSKVTRDKYKRRLQTFFEFVGIEGFRFQEKCDNFVKQVYK